MQTFETIKSRSQDTFNNLMEKGKEQPNEVKTLGITAGSAVVGAIAVSAVAKGVVAVLAALATPPVALTVGAVGGGLLGWNWMQDKAAATAAAAADAADVSAESAAGAPVAEAAAV